MRVIPGTASFLPDLTDDQIARQIAYALRYRWAISVEHTDEPPRRNPWWQMWGAPMFAPRDAEAVMEEVRACRAAYPDRYVKVVAFDAIRGRETVRLSFVVQRPEVEPRFDLLREECAGRRVRYTVRTRRAHERSAP